MTITDFCEELNNYFDVDRIFGTFTISNGNITVPDGYLQNNQYFRIVGSVFNDGVYKYPANDLTDETFKGAVWAMAVSPTAIALLKKIEEWDNKYGNSVDNYSPYQSETFYHYSRVNAITTNTKGERVPTTWQSYFSKELNRWRKI